MQIMMSYDRFGEKILAKIVRFGEQRNGTKQNKKLTQLSIVPKCPDSSD